MRLDLSPYRAGITVASLLVCVVVTVTCLYFSIFTVFPHLYYLPIVLVAYWYPRQGIAFSVGAAVIYAGLVLLFAPLDAPVMISTALRCIVFVGIGTLVTLLTMRLQRGEEQYRGIAEHTGVGTLILDRDQIIRYANREANRILGIGDARGRSWMECVAPGERERVRGYHQSRQQDPGGAPDRYEVQMLREESEEFFAYVSVGALVDGYVISFLDLSDRREIEEELRQSEERYRTIADHLPRGLVHIMDRDLRYRFSAGEGLERLHLRHEDLVGRSIFEILDPEDARVVAGAYRHVLETGEPVSFQGEFAGEVFLIRAVPLRASDGSIDQLLALSVTITEQHRAEEALRASEAQFRRLVEGSPDPILVHVGGTVRFVNPSARRLFTCGSPDELIGKDIRDLFTDDCRRLGEDWLPESGRPPGAPPIEATIAGCDPPRMVELMTTPSRFEGEDATILSLRDITSRKEYERRIVSLNRQLTAVGQIVQLANSSLDLQEMEEHILSGIIDTIGFDAGCIYLKDTDQKTAILSAEKNLPEWFRERWAEINMHHYPYNLIFYAGRPRYLENTPEHQISMLDVPFLEDAGVISLAAVPLRADATVMGGLFVGKFEEGRISAEEQRTLEMIGSELGEMLVRGQIQEELMASRSRARRILDLLEHDFQTQRALLHEYASQLEEYHDDTLSRIAGWVHESLERTAYIYRNCSILRKILDPLPTDTVGLDGVVHRAIDSVPGLVFSCTDAGHSVQAGDLLEDALIFLFEQMVGSGEGPLIGEVEESGERVILTIRGPVSSLSATAAMRIFEEEISPADPLFRLQAARLIIERYGGEFTISDQMVGGSPDLEVRLSLQGGGEDHRDDDGIGAVPDGTLTGEDLV